MEAEESAKPRESRQLAEFHFLLARQNQSGAHIFSLSGVRVISAEIAMAAVDRNDSGLLRNLLETNVPLLLVGNGALQRLSSGEGESNEDPPEPDSAQDASRRSDQQPGAPAEGVEVFSAPQLVASGISPAGPMPPVREARARISSRIMRAVEFMRVHAEEAISLDDVSREACLSPCYFCRLFRKELGTTFSKYLASIRVDKATQLLLNTDLSITEICYRVGFNDLTHFERVFRSKTRLTPTRFRAETA